MTTTKIPDSIQALYEEVVCANGAVDGATALEFVNRIILGEPEIAGPLINDFISQHGDPATASQILHSNLARSLQDHEETTGLSFSQEIAALGITPAEMESAMEENDADHTHDDELEQTEAPADTENDKEDGGILAMLGLGKLEDFASMLGIDNLQEMLMGLIEKVLGFFGLGDLTNAFNSASSGEEDIDDPALSTTAENKSAFKENTLDATVAPLLPGVDNMPSSENKLVVKPAF